VIAVITVIAFDTVVNIAVFGAAQVLYAVTVLSLAVLDEAPAHE